MLPLRSRRLLRVNLTLLERRGLTLLRFPAGDSGQVARPLLRQRALDLLHKGPRERLILHLDTRLLVIFLQCHELIE